MIDKIVRNKDRSISFAAIIISIVAIIQTSVNLGMQRKHNHLSVKPIPSAMIQNYENLISVKLYNAGIGPLIIRDFSVIDTNGNIKNNLIDFMPVLPDSIYWSNYRHNIDNGSITPNSCFDLLELIGDHKNSAFSSYRDDSKGILKDLILKLEYTDIYNNKFEVKYWAMNGFKRSRIGKCYFFTEKNQNY